MVTALSMFDMYAKVFKLSMDSLGKIVVNIYKCSVMFTTRLEIVAVVGNY